MLKSEVNDLFCVLIISIILMFIFKIQVQDISLRIKLNIRVTF
jgi:hypothetical protein